MVRNSVVAVTDGMTFGRATGKWSVAEQPCHNTRALLVNVTKNETEDPRAQRRGTGTLIKKRSSKTLEVAVAFKCTPLLRAKRARPSEVFVPVRPEQGRACSRRTQLQLEVEFWLQTPAPWIHRLQCHQLMGELYRRPAKHVFRDKLRADPTHQKVLN